MRKTGLMTWRRAQFRKGAWLAHKSTLNPFFGVPLITPNYKTIRLICYITFHLQFVYLLWIYFLVEKGFLHTSGLSDAANPDGEEELSRQTAKLDLRYDERVREQRGEKRERENQPGGWKERERSTHPHSRNYYNSTTMLKNHDCVCPVGFKWSGSWGELLLHLPINVLVETV